MKNIMLTVALLLTIVSCSSSNQRGKPNLYSAVLPMADGTFETTTTANSKSKSLIRATRNAERYCYSKYKSYVTVSIDKKYEGLIQDEKAAGIVDKAIKVVDPLTLGLLPLGTDDDYVTDLVFKCVSE